MKPEMSKREKARRAKARGSKTFIAHCEKCGTDRKHYASSVLCVTCEKQRDRRRTEARRQDPELKKKHNDAVHRRYLEDLGKSRERAAATEWRKATKAEKMHAWYEYERQAMQAVYAGLIEAKRGNEPDKMLEKFRQQGDHLIPKVGKGVIDGEEKIVVNGLHTFANLAPLSAVLNQKKGSDFEPDLCRYQKPANRHSGGAWDPELTDEERERIQERWTVEGVPLEESLRTHRDVLDRDARAYEEHLRKTYGMEILVDPAWFECHVLPEWKALEGPRYKGFEEEPDEETVRAFAARNEPRNTTNAV
ncbi:hypothetical protein [Caballeronia novacaledonica]|uniref:Uncharacterized protein n=1 Tax=Caballeronia novacaledonica TaxID=1544861 RepID=A0AA37MGN5_9BURK|nr:hypothetical protein [Caballeronia novacaledonica]GJH23698.1 hypothetical protein CBA19CS42_04300 [Caballeronia novacaledonica]